MTTRMSVHPLDEAAAALTADPDKAARIRDDIAASGRDPAVVRAALLEAAGYPGSVLVRIDAVELIDGEWWAGGRTRDGRDVAFVAGDEGPAMRAALDDGPGPVEAIVAAAGLLDVESWLPAE